MREYTENVIRGTAFFFLIGLSFSLELWFRSADVPLIPVFNFIPDIFGELCNVLSIALALSLFWLLIRPNRICAAIILIVVSTLVLFDEVKAQPWVYHYSLFFVPLFFHKKSNRSIFYVVMLSGIYILSGISKLNQEFVEVVMPMMVDNEFMSNINSSWLGYTVGLLECLLGGLLLTKNWRGMAIYSLILMHLILIIWLGWFSVHINTIVIPWNCGMILLLLLLRVELRDNVGIVDIVKSMNKYQIALLISILLVIPIVTKACDLNKAFRFSLYSSGYTRMYVAVELNERLLNGMAETRVLIEGLEGGDIIDLNAWINSDLGVPIPTYKGFYHRLRRSLCGSMNSEGLMFIIPKSDTDVEYLNCDD